MRFVSRTVVTSIVAALAACGGSTNSGGPDAPSAPDAATGFQPAPHTPLPQAIPHGGKVLAHPQLVTITFDATDDTHTALEASFGDAIVKSTWLATVGADYGVDNVGTSNTTVDIGPAPTSIDSTGIQTLIQTKINDGTLPAPSATGDQHIYMLYVPRKVTLGADLGGECGHHAAGTAKGVTIAYAATLDPDPSVGCGDVPGITATSAHEIAEAATDPYDPPNDGWYIDPPLPDPWWMSSQEVGDLCDYEALIDADGFPVQRIWSNTAVKAGRSPCIPFSPDDHYNSVTADPAAMPTIAKGTSTTFTLTGWSTDAIADWKIDTGTADYSDLDTTQTKPTLSASMINNGKTVTLTLSAPANATSGQLGGVWVYSYAPNNVYRLQPVGFIVQ